MIRFAVIPLFGTRVAPRCSCTDDFMLVRMRSEEIISTEAIHLNCEEEDAWLESLIDIGIDIFVCGGIEREHQRRLETSGILVISNVAADLEDVLPALANNRLKSWFGYKSIASASEPHTADLRQDETAPCLLNCIQCDDRTCLAGKGCVVYTDTEPVPIPDKSPSGKDAGKDFSFYLTSLAGAPISRMEDLGSYCRSLHCHRLGIVFCTAIFAEIDWILDLVDNSIQAIPICCQFGCHRDEESLAPDQRRCDPETLIAILNDTHCDLVMTIGPCARFNDILDRHSRAPVITTIAKDRMAGGNLFPSVETCEERASWRREKVC